MQVNPKNSQQETSPGFISRTRDTSPPREKYYIEQLHGDEAKLREAKWRLVIYKFYIDKRNGRPGK